MAQLKANSTVDSIEICKKDCSNFPTNLPSALISQLRGNTGSAGSAGANGSSGSSGTISISGSTLTITPP